MHDSCIHPFPLRFNFHDPRVLIITIFDKIIFFISVLYTHGYSKKAKIGKENEHMYFIIICAKHFGSWQ